MINEWVKKQMLATHPILNRMHQIALYTRNLPYLQSTLLTSVPMLVYIHIRFPLSCIAATSLFCQIISYTEAMQACYHTLFT